MVLEVLLAHIALLGWRAHRDCLILTSRDVAPTSRSLRQNCLATIPRSNPISKERMTASRT